MKRQFGAWLHQIGGQPPSGGCVLKPRNRNAQNRQQPQPPSGGCVLKPKLHRLGKRRIFQPPSGGCVLKHLSRSVWRYWLYPAAFGRLRVETRVVSMILNNEDPAAFGRLRVETSIIVKSVPLPMVQPPSGGCVLKQSVWVVFEGSVVPAAFGRLRVETRSVSDGWCVPFQPPSGGCVLKQMD